MPRRFSGGNARKPSGGNTRRVRQKGKNTYAAKQAWPSPYWLAQGAYRSQLGQPAAHPEMGRKNKPKDTPQKKKPPGRGGRGGKGGKR